MIVMWFLWAYVTVCVYTDKAQLCLFGSSKNGFGFRDSDLDICMTLEGHNTAEVLSSSYT